MVLFYLIKEVFYNFFIIIFFLIYIKISANTDLTYYKKNRDLVLSKAKYYYKNNKDRLREQARDKYRNLSEEEKNTKREYGKNRYQKMSEEKKTWLKEYQKNYREAKTSQYMIIK